MATKVNWAEAVKPLIKKYKDKKHPLEYKNLYQLMVMVVLAAQTSDALINIVTPEFFKAFPDVKSLAKADPESLFPYLSKVRGFRKKAEWLIKTAKQIGSDKNIPKTMDELVKLPGIGRKSANVILRGAGMEPEGVMVDLHVVRVAPRLGIAKGDDPTSIEKQIMEKVPKSEWDVGMAISFLGREICHNTKPEHEKCIMKGVCEFYNKLK